MFCRVKQDKDIYRFYLCERKRVEGKVKSSDKFIIGIPRSSMGRYSSPDRLKHKVQVAVKEKIGKPIIKPRDIINSKVLEIRKELSEAEIREEEQWEQERQENRKKWEEDQQEWKNEYEQYQKQFNNICSAVTIKHYTEKEKEYLKTIYKAGAIKLHPDIAKDDGEAMKFLNKLKDDWGV